MPIAHLDGRALIHVCGEEAEHFLQNILTVDLAVLGLGEAKPGALLTPQGKILFDFLVSRLPEGLRLECRADVADDFMRRLMLYRLRAKVQIALADKALVAVSWQNESAASGDESGAVRDTRFPSEDHVRRHYGVPPAADASTQDWHRFRISRGVAESGADYALGDAFPHDVLLDQTGGVGFKKGCYIGQEVVSRMQHRGTARRRVLIARGDSDLPPAETPVIAGGRAIGTLGSSAGRDGLALVRIDRVKEAMDAGEDIFAGDVRLSLEIPAWARFGFPADAPAAEG